MTIIQNEYFDCSKCGVSIYRNPAGQIRNKIGGDHHDCVRELRLQLASLRGAFAAFEPEVDPRCAEVQKKEGGGHVTCCKCQKSVLVAIEREHLEQARSIARRLYTDERLTADEMRDAGHILMGIIRYAEALEAMREPGKPSVLHVCPTMEKIDE